MISASEFQDTVIRPVLKLIGLSSPSAENLLLGTALVESNLSALKQVNGPALGFYQIEPDTHQDAIRYLNRADNKALKERVLAACFIDVFPNDDALMWNLRYATCIARVIYWRFVKPLPDANDIEGLGKYWKFAYNTYKGDGTVDRFINAWNARVI